jgi:hypothetical protein
MYVQLQLLINGYMYSLCIHFYYYQLLLYIYLICCCMIDMIHVQQQADTVEY